ncbi:MAG: elongation factor Ts [bacterium]
MVTTEQIKELRNKTGISIAQCKKSLEESGGDMAKALEDLKAKGADIAGKKSGRDLRAGAVGSYIHSDGSMGAIVVLSSETDFVSKNPEFKAAADDLAMHIAAMCPVDVAELMAQPFVKDVSQTIDVIINGLVQKFGERIEVLRFSRLDTSVN